MNLRVDEHMTAVRDVRFSFVSGSKAYVLGVQATYSVDWSGVTIMRTCTSGSHWKHATSGNSPSP